MKTYSYLKPETIRLYLNDMKKRGVSKVARSNGFTRLYLQGMNPRTKKATINQTWEQKRHNYIKRRLSQPYKLFDSPGIPSRYHLSLISWGYSPSRSIRKIDKTF